MSLILPPSGINKLYLGNTEIPKIYLGNNEVFSASSFEPEYQAVLDYATGQGWATPDQATNVINNQRILNLKTIGVWGEFAHLYRFKYDDLSLEDFSRIDWVTAFPVSKVGSPTYTLDGWRGGASTSDRIQIGSNTRINTFCTAGDTTIIYDRVNATISGGWGSSWFSASNSPLGYYNFGRMYMWTNSPTLALPSNNSGFKVFVSNNATGAKIYYRDGAISATSIYIEGTIGLSSVRSYPLTCVRSGSGSFNSNMTTPMAMVAFGTGAIGAQQSDVYLILTDQY